VTLPTDAEVEEACAKWARMYFSWADDVPEKEIDSAQEGFRAAICWLRNREKKAND